MDNPTAEMGTDTVAHSDATNQTEGEPPGAQQPQPTKTTHPERATRSPRRREMTVHGEVCGSTTA